MTNEFEPIAFLTPLNDGQEENVYEMETALGMKKRCYRLLSFDNDRTGKSYLVYSFNEEDEEGNHEVYAAVYREGEEGLWLAKVETEREWDEIERALQYAIKMAREDTREKEHKKNEEGEFVKIINEDGEEVFVEVLSLITLEDNDEYLVYTKNEINSEGEYTVYINGVDRSQGEPILTGIDTKTYERVRKKLDELLDEDINSAKEELINLAEEVEDD